MSGTDILGIFTEFDTKAPSNDSDDNDESDESDKLVFVRALLRYVENDLRSLLEISYRRVWPGICSTPLMDRIARKSEYDPDTMIISDDANRKINTLGYMMYQRDDRHLSSELRFVFGHVNLAVEDAHNKNDEIEPSVILKALDLCSFNSYSINVQGILEHVLHVLTTGNGRHYHKHLQKVCLNLREKQLVKTSTAKRGPLASLWQLSAGNGCDCCGNPPVPPLPDPLPPPIISPSDVSTWAPIIRGYQSLHFAKQLIQQTNDRFEVGVAPFRRDLNQAQTNLQIAVETLTCYLTTLIQAKPLSLIVIQFFL